MCCYHWAGIIMVLLQLVCRSNLQSKLSDTWPWKKEQTEVTTWCIDNYRMIPTLQAFTGALHPLPLYTYFWNNSAFTILWAYLTGSKMTVLRIELSCTYSIILFHFVLFCFVSFHFRFHSGFYNIRVSSVLTTSVAVTCWRILEHSREKNID